MDSTEGNPVHPPLFASDSQIVHKDIFESTCDRPMRARSYFLTFEGPEYFTYFGGPRPTIFFVTLPRGVLAATVRTDRPRRPSALTVRADRPRRPSARTVRADRLGGRTTNIDFTGINWKQNRWTDFQFDSTALFSRSRTEGECELFQFLP